VTKGAFMWNLKASPDDLRWILNLNAMNAGA
jgi:hypothetical protein